MSCRMMVGGANVELDIRFDGATLVMEVFFPFTSWSKRGGQRWQNIWNRSNQVRTLVQQNRKCGDNTVSLCEWVLHMWQPEVSLELLSTFDLIVLSANFLFSAWLKQYHWTTEPLSYWNNPMLYSRSCTSADFRKSNLPYFCLTDGMVTCFIQLLLHINYYNLYVVTISQRSKSWPVNKWPHSHNSLTHLIICYLYVAYIHQPDIKFIAMETEEGYPPHTHTDLLNSATFA